MSELAKRLLAVIECGPIEFSVLWASIPYDPTFDEMQAALTELIEAGKIEQIDATLAYRLACAA